MAIRMSKEYMDIPNNWCISTIGKICSKPQYGWTTKANFDGGELKLLRTTDIASGFVDWQTVPYCTEQPEDVNKYAIQRGDILISRAGSVGISYLVTEAKDAVFASYLIRFKPKKEINDKYVYLFLKSPLYWNSISISKAGIAVPNVNASKLSQIRIPIAPINEQDRIVAEIEKQFSRLDEAVENLQRVKANLKRYKASVLKAAVEGKLTEQWRAEHPDVETASRLLERILKERRKKWEENELAKMKAKGKAPKDEKWKKKYKAANVPKTKDLSELPRGWRWCCLGQLLHSIKAGKSFKCEERPPKGKDIGVVKVSAVTWGEFNELESKTVTDISKINQDYYIHVGDFLFSRANTIELVGACVIVKPFNLKLMLSDKILRFDFVYDLKRWCLACLRTRFGRDEIENLATGNQNSMRNISQTNIFKIRVPLPPLPEQQEISQEIENQLIVVQKLEGEVSKNMRRADRLRQSILKKAFSGKLIPPLPAYDSNRVDELPMAAEATSDYGAKR